MHHAAVKYSRLNAGKQRSVGFLKIWKKTSQTTLLAGPGLCFSYLTSFRPSELGIRSWDAVVFAAAPAPVSQAPCQPFPQVMVLVVEKPLEYRWGTTETVPEREQLPVEAVLASISG